MAKQNTTTEITVDPITGWPSAVPEMAELERAAEAAHSRHETMTERLAAAQREVQAGVAKRDALVERTRAGEVVPGTEVAGVEIEIRAAESSAALMIEALPSLEAEVEKADRALLALGTKVHGQMVAHLRAARKKAEDDVKAAQAREDDAWRALNQAGVSDSMFKPGAEHADEAVSLYAPIAFARIAAWRDRKAPKPVSSAPSRPPSWAVPQPSPSPAMTMSDHLAARYGA